MKKIISLILMLTLCALCLSSCALFNGERRFGFYKYTVENEEVTITGYTGRDTDLTIPEAIKGMPVVAIGISAFRGCTTIKTVTIPDSVVKIGVLAFDCCSSLERVTLGRGVREMDSSVFSECNRLICNEYEDGRYLGNEENPYLALVSVVSKDIETITIHPDTVIIGGSSIEDCKLLREITFPEGVVSLGSLALWDCSASETVYIPKTVESLGRSVFVGCDALQAIMVSEENPYFKSVDGSLFSRDGSRLIMYAVGQTSASYRVPDGTVVITSAAFENAKHLTEVVLPDSVEELENDAFSQCENLSSIHFGNGLKKIGTYAFSNCAKLESVVIVSSVKELDAYAFAGCSAICEIVFEDPKGWKGSSLHTIIPEQMDFSDPRKNAEYLSGMEYGYLYWNKE
jgi:hypothetical protein